jgi:hypothetical protein
MAFFKIVEGTVNSRAKDSRLRYGTVLYYILALSTYRYSIITVTVKTTNKRFSPDIKESLFFTTAIGH